MEEKIDKDFFGRFERSEEEMNEIHKWNYQAAKENPENMSYWLPKITESSSRIDSSLLVPKTMIVQLPYAWWAWLRSDNYTDDKLDEFNDAFIEQIKDFLPGQKLFMKTGIFSDKFTFCNTVIDNGQKISRNLLNIYYNSMVFGADRTAEVVFRKWIGNTEGRRSIYSGMPLRTEFRVFYDFDAKNVVGISNYWHPDVMERGLRHHEDKVAYENTRELLVNDFDQCKQMVAYEVHHFMKGCNSLTGKWSVDVMKNGDEYWLIDMARMELSALVDQMEIFG